ncbi:efflux RND transporter permease subunit [Endozoicomonas euniceicola]|uniref:Efflux RND transporter permease subunit n=1 Tax=Endozoicomonas euniceicola TaxID=1234143 RepID=A0ABY6GTR0_9GAMM|nr:efflux RND transporter permease subunit [Endozoicomonas euniceicola]UYM16080.1 efflux RND transporter permease subunit [Endozoicomonas euniceicola]
MKAFLRFFVERRFFASMVLAITCVMGIIALLNITLQELPAAKQGETVIITEYPGVSAEEIELEITNRIEKELKTVKGISWYQSISVDGLSEIEILIRDGEDIDLVNQDIRAAVDRVTDLPANLKNAPLVEAENTATFEFFIFSISGDMPYAELREAARQLEKKLRALDGIGKVDTAGYLLREFIVDLNPDRLNSYGINPQTVVDAIARRNQSSSGGIVESWLAEKNLLTLTQVQSAAELEQSIITMLPGGSPLRLKDIAEVRDGFERPSEAFVANGEKGIGFTLFKTESGDILKTVDAVKALLRHESERTGGKLKFSTSLNLSEEISDRFRVVRNNGLIGAILVLAVLLITIQRRLAPWITTSLPVCVFGTVSMLLLFGYSLDSISMSAILLVIGIIVDDSIVVAESIDQKYHQGLPPVEAAVEGYSEVFRPVVTSLLTTLLVFVPMLFMGGDFGATYAILPITIMMALLVSMLDVTLLLPAHLAHAMSGTESRQQNQQKQWFLIIKNRYQHMLGKVIAARYAVVPVVLIAGMCVLYLSLSQLKLDFFPTSAARLLELSIEVQDGTSLDKVTRIQQPLLKLLKETPEVQRYHIRQTTPESTGLIILTPAETRSQSADEVAGMLEDAALSIPGVTDADIKVDAGGPPPPDPLEFRIFGSNDASRLQMAQDLKQWLAKQSGVVELEVSDDNRRPQAKILPDYQWLARLGLSVEDINRTLNLAYEGAEASTSWVGDDEVSIKVWLDSKWRNADYLPNLDIPSENGETVPLRRVARIETVMAPRELSHWNGDRSSLVAGDIEEGTNDDDDDVESGNEATTSLKDSDAIPNAVEISEKAIAHFNQLAARYPGVRLEAGGEAEMTNSALRGLTSAMLMAMVGIWMIIALLFGSLFQPLLVILIIPFAVVSAATALLLHGQPMSFFAAVGILGLCGVVVNNALVMVDRMNRQYKQAAPELVIHSIIEAAGSRLRPILLTSVTTVAGLLPLAYGLGGSDVYMGPMALTLGYGILLTVPVILFLLPCCYLIGQDITKLPERNKSGS